MADYPRILLQGERYRFIEDERPNNSGIFEKVHTIEVFDGYDAMGVPRWIDAYKRDAVSTYAGAVTWLKAEVGKLLNKE